MAQNPDKHLTSRLRNTPDFTGLWVRDIKQEAMYRRCHEIGQFCEGEESVVLAAPAQFDDSRCYPPSKLVVYVPTTELASPLERLEGHATTVSVEPAYSSATMAIRPCSVSRYGTETCA